MTTATATRPTNRRATFQAQSPLRAELCRRVDAYFAERGTEDRGGAAWAGKALTIFAWAIASYVGLVFFATTWWTALPLALSLGFALAGIGFCVMHDGGHGAASKKGWVNKLGFAAVDFIGGASYFWHYKHNLLHHTYTNVEGLDEDIDSTPFLRLAPSQRRRFYHRFQTWYVLPLLGFFVPKWGFFDDWKTWITGEISGTRIPRPRGWDAVQLVTGKLWYYAWAIALPLVYHSPLEVLGGFLVASTTLGITLAIVFQLAHVVEGTQYVDLPESAEKFELPFFEHQLATTSDFAQNSRLVTWYVGGLNFQVEHHLFPRIAHRHYPAIAKITEEVCREHGVAYHRHPTLFAAIRSHFRLLDRLGKQDSLAAA